MRTQFGRQAVPVLLAFGLFAGALAATQQPQPASHQRSAVGQLALNPTHDGNTPANTSSTVEKKPEWNYSTQGMYDEYRKHWNARSHDSDFMIFQAQQAKRPAPNTGANRAGEKRPQFTYDQFSQQPALWSNRSKGAQAWQTSDAYWRLSDTYWRDPNHRQLPGYEQYWKVSAAYWSDSQRYWDIYARDRKGDDAAPAHEPEAKDNP